MLTLPSVWPVFVIKACTTFYMEFHLCSLQSLHKMQKMWRRISKWIASPGAKSKRMKRDIDEKLTTVFDIRGLSNGFGELKKLL